MKRKLLLLALAALGLGAFAYAQANVSSQWVGGDLYFYDVSGNAILQFDGTNRKLVVPSGSVLDLDAATGAVLFAAGEIVSADIAADTIAAADIATGAVATAEILDGTILNEDIGAAAAIARSKLAEDALQSYPVELREDDWGALTLAEAAGTFNYTLGTNLINLKGEVSDNETETSVGYFQVILPPEYVSAGDVNVAFRHSLVSSGAPNNNGSDIDLSCYEQTDGAVGADLVTTAAQTFSGLDAYETDTFVLTATGLVAGDVLVCKVTLRTIDDEAGAGTITWTADPIKLKLDVKG